MKKLISLLLILVLCCAAALAEKKIIRKTGLPVKVLGNGKITKNLTVKLNAFSASAAEKIAAAGGKAEVI